MKHKKSVDTFVVRDNRSGFLWIGKDIFEHFAPKLHHSTFMIYLALANFANNNSQQCFPSQAVISKTVGASERTVRYALQELKEIGLITWTLSSTEAGQHFNIYTLIQPADFAVRQPSVVEPAKNDIPTGNGLPKNKTQEQDSELDRAVLWLADQYRTLFNRPNWTLTTLRRDKAIARISECLKKNKNDLRASVATMLMAMKAMHASKFHMGDNERKTKYVEWESHLYKSAEKLEQWVDHASYAMRMPTREFKPAAPLAPVNPAMRAVLDRAEKINETRSN